MPLHDFECASCGDISERVVPAGVEFAECPVCLATAQKVFLRAPAGFVQADICYDSPVTGEAITTKQKRIEDLARNECIPYEPGMRQDAERVRRESDQRLEKAFDASVDEFFATAGARKVEKLEQELRAGASAEFTRVSPAETVN